MSVQVVYRTGATGVFVDAELKVDGMPLQRIRLGEHLDKSQAEAAFMMFMGRLQAGE